MVFHYLELLNKKSTNKIPILSIVLLLLIASFGHAYPLNQQMILTDNNTERAITWDVTLHFNEPGSTYDYVIFGEAPDANDGPPADTYDTVKPPPPMPSYIRSWFNDNLPYPYNNLWKDYRQYPDDAKTWNLSVQWVPSDGSSSTTVTISWGSAEINTSEYTIITLCTNGGTPLKNMLASTSYSFVCPPFIPQSFKIICVANEQPNSPSNPIPANGAIAVLINTDLGWTCSDPDGDPLTYDVYLGTSSTPPKVASNISTTTYDPGNLNAGTIYYWKIVAWDPYSFSRAGPTWQFRTNYPPNQPSDPTPMNGTTGVSINEDLDWTGGDQDPGDTVTYNVFFGTTSSPPKVADNISLTSFDPGTLAYNTLYYWRIVAFDNHAVSAIGPLWHFTTGIQPNQPPNPPSNPIPANGSTGIPITTDLDWTCSDPDNDPLTYDVYFGTSNPPPKVASNISTSDYNLGNLQYYTFYYWRIVAWDDHAHSTSGPLWRFRTMNKINTPPDQPKNPLPSNGSINVPLTPTLSWTCYDQDGDYLTYDVYFGSTFPLTKIKSNMSGTSVALDTLQYNTKYYWRVVAWDTHQEKNSSGNWSFTTKKDTTPPGLTINCPKNGYLYMNLGNVFVRTLFIFFTTFLIGQIELSVTATDTESGMNRVEIWIDTELVANLTHSPYKWTWTERGFGFQYTVTFKAYDNAGNVNPISQKVWKIL